MSRNHFAEQQALFDALKAASICDGRIWDEAPQKEEKTDADNIFPYVLIGEMVSSTEDMEGYNGSISFIDLEIWTRAAGKKQGKEIGAAIHDAIHAKVLSVNGMAYALFEIDQERTFREADGISRRLVQTIRIESYGVETET